MTFVECAPPAPTRWEKLQSLVLGRPLASTEEEAHKLGPLVGVPALGLDALASAAYGPEAALTLLLPLGAAGPAHLLSITAVIVTLALIVYVSYRQTITAYPLGGGSYTVAKENLHPTLGLIAAAALATDYVLNVAVAISAGVGALVSAIPALHPHLLPLCLGLLCLLALVNLRGTREAGLAFTLPTYLFIGCMGAVIAVATYRALTAAGHPMPVLAPPRPVAAVAVATPWLLLRAFASGCTALTGIEAVSNGITAFREPRVPNARRTLGLIVGTLACLLAGVAYAAHAYGISATEPGSSNYQSVLSLVTGAVVGRGAFYYVTMGAVVTVLCLSANTSFAGFPRLCSVLASEGYLPELFAMRGRRLVFSAGVTLLAALAGLLLLTFGGVTDRLIPLFAIGALLAFTLSQAGMVAHWRKRGGGGHRGALVQNLVGAVATGATCAIVLVSKFVEGAWVAVLALLVMALSFAAIRRHYASAAREVRDDAPLDCRPPAPPVVVVPLQGWNKLASRALRFALGFSDDIHALHVLTEDSRISELTAVWEDLVAEPARAAGRPVPELALRHSRFRQFFAPLLEYVDHVRESHPGREIVVIVPSLVPRRWFQAFLHNERGALLKALLRARGGPGVVVVSMPYYLTRAAGEAR